MMKKVIFILMLGVSLFSCSEDSSLLSNTESEVLGINQRTQVIDSPRVDDGYLVFSCEESLESFIRTLAKRESEPKSIGERYGFESYLNSVKRTDENEDIFGDEYFAGVLNKDGLIAVGDYLFKLNPETRETFVIAYGSKKGVEQALIASEEASQLPRTSMVFSFDDEVFEILGKEVLCESEEKCNEDCASTDIDSNSSVYCVNNRGGYSYYIHVKYAKVSIWKYANVQLKHNGFLDVFVNPGSLDLRYSAKWKKRCRDEAKASRDYVCDFVPTGVNEECFPINGIWGHKKRFYHGTRCLSKYHFKADARVQHGCDNTLMVWTGQVEIKDGF